MTAEFIVNHLWQSSCVGLLASLLAFMLRGNSPKVRYWVWLSASLKFLVPWVLLVNLGSLVPWPDHRAASVATSTLPDTLVQIAEPFSPSRYAAVQTQAQTHWGVTALTFLWAAGFIVIAFTRCRSWYGVRAMLRAGTPVKLPIAVPVFVTPGAQEPGVVGFLKPVLVLPALLLERLNPKQLDALLAHELSHVRRRDNFFAALHMVVEAVFWFHPLVWWIGSRMLEERELACDEEVLRLGCEPTDYARGILTVCEHYSEAPLACVSGVTGADIKKRLRAILAGRIAHELNVGKKAVLAAIGLATLAAPIVIGILNAPAMQGQSSAPTPKFEVATVKRCVERRAPGIDSSPGKATVNCTTVANLIDMAYHRYANGQFNPPWPAMLEGGPAWIRTDAYQIVAKAEDDHASREMMFGPMTQALLEDRFKLKLHRETTEVPVYALTVAKGDSKLREHQEQRCTVFDPTKPVDPTRSQLTLAPDQKPPCKGISLSRDGQSITLTAEGVSIDQLYMLGGIAVDRPVINKTGITGNFSFRLEFTPDEPIRAAQQAREGGTPPGPNDPIGGPSIFTALEQQLGLKLEATKGPAERLVVDSVERPSEN
jgi:bla regulator protein BlaR1